MAEPYDSGNNVPAGFRPAGELPSRESAPTPTPQRSRKIADEFTGAPTPAQFKLPADLIASLRLLGIQTGKSMSELVFEALTTETTIPKAWVSTRKSA